MNTTSPSDYPVPKRKAHAVLALLFLLMAFDFIDRQVLSALLPAIKADWRLSDTQLGMLVSAVNVALAVLALPVSVIVDGWSRTRAIGVMGILWSLATGVCMFAGNFYHLLIARFAVGVGEAGYGPAGYALLSGLYPARLRATVIGIFQSANTIGTLVGVMLGGFVAARWGWRSAFGVVAVPGLLLAVMMMFATDYKTVAVSIRDGQSGAVREASRKEVLRMLIRSRVLICLVLGQTAVLFFVSTFGNWLPSFLHRAHGMPLDKASLRTGMILIVVGCGVALCGWLTDRFVGPQPHRRLYVAAGLVTISALQFIAAFCLPPDTMQMALIFGGAFFMMAMTAPVTSALVDMVPLGMRSSASGMLITATNLFGMALGPTVGGMLSDRYDLQTALLIVALCPLPGAVGYVLAGRGYNRARASLSGDELPAPVMS